MSYQLKVSEPKVGNMSDFEECEDAENAAQQRSKSPERKNPNTSKKAKSKSEPSEIEIGFEMLIKFIKPYDGSRESLNSFLINCNNSYDLASLNQKPIIFRYILSQLTGKAEIACSIKEFANWEQLKDFLKAQFSERKHSAHLLTELQETKQRPGESVSQFSLRVETCLSQLLTEISLSNTKVKDLSGRCAAMEDLALHHFLMGLYPRISNIVRCRSPKNLNEAINIAISEERIQQTLYKRNQVEENRPRRAQQPQQNQNNASISRQPNFQPRQSNPITCRYCKAIGHDISNCRKREYNNNRFRTQNQPSGSNNLPRIHFVETPTPTDFPQITYTELDNPDEQSSDHHLNE